MSETEWVLVPRVPTEAMEAARRMYGDTSDWWNAMLASAPQPPSGGERRWCPSCDGAGWTPDTMDGSQVRCPDCAGSGLAEDSISANEARTAPPSAPVGVEAIRQARAIIDHVIHDEPGYELSAAHDLLTTALAQQPSVAPSGPAFDVIRKAVEDASPRWGEEHDNPMLHKLSLREREWIAGRVFQALAQQGGES